MKRTLKEVAKEYAATLKKRPHKRFKAEHVVEVLTMQSGFPMAVNSGTRPTVCGVLKAELGETFYQSVCRDAKDLKRFEVPSLTAVSSAACCGKSSSVPIVDAMRARFPTDATLLLQQGAQRITLLQQDEVATLIAALCKHKVGTTKALTAAQGNGTNGCYATLDMPLPPILQRVMDAAKGWIEKHTGHLKSPLGKKALLLRYGLGGINLAHQDYSGDFQALLMLSRPGIDYNGGVLYLRDKRGEHAAEFPFAAAGELIVFRGNRGGGSVDWMHGMTAVAAGGGGGETRRFAVGLFQ